MEDDLLTLTEAAYLLGKSRATLYRLITEGKIIPQYRPAYPRTPLFREGDLKDLLIAGPKESVLNHKLHKAAKQRDGGKCLVCESTRLVTAHHVVPLEQGGSDELENLVTLCRGCNTSIHGSGSTILQKARKHGTLALARWLLKQAGHNLD